MSAVMFGATLPFMNSRSHCFSKMVRKPVTSLRTALLTGRKLR